MNKPGFAEWCATHRQFKPILGAGRKRDMTDDEFFSHVLYPVIATPKFDGIRCITIIKDASSSELHLSKPVCRSLDRIPNNHIFNTLAQLPPGLDGEIMTYEDMTLFDQSFKQKKFYEVQSDVMSEQGAPNFRFHVFDRHNFNVQYPWLETYELRLSQLSDIVLPDCCYKVMGKRCTSREELEEYERECIANGYEGICWRHIHAKYKYGRSTLRSQELIKMKRFETSEAKIIEAYEEMRNDNPSAQNALGNAERSSHKANMVGKGALGGFTCLSEQFAEQFNVGSGFNRAEREDLWKRRAELIGKTITFKHQPYGGKIKPRIPIFIGFRDHRDL